MIELGKVLDESPVNVVLDLLRELLLLEPLRGVHVAACHDHGGKKIGARALEGVSERARGGVACRALHLDVRMVEGVCEIRSGSSKVCEPPIGVSTVAEERRHGRVEVTWYGLAVHTVGYVVHHEREDADHGRRVCRPSQPIAASAHCAAIQTCGQPEAAHEKVILRHGGGQDGGNDVADEAAVEAAELSTDGTRRERRSEVVNQWSEAVVSVFF